MAAPVTGAPLPSGSFPTAVLRPVPIVVGALVVGGASIAIGYSVSLRPTDPIRLVYATIGLLTIVQLLLGTVNSRRSASRAVTRSSYDSDHHRVAVLVPVYNEDEQVLRRVVRALLEQTRRPDMIAVVDDGSTCGYGRVRAEFTAAAAQVGVAVTWERIENAGKRQAQVHALASVPEATVLVTVDSDSILDRRAVERGLAPFADDRVQSVAAIALSENVRKNVLTKLMDVFCVGLQLFERSACSVFGAVLVNSGACALYRAEVMREEVGAYLSETMFGRHVQFSDDSLLTLFALQRGRAVQQDDCFVFTVMPERMSHHRRQQLRWLRGSCIRSLWRFRYLPLGHPAYWCHLVKWSAYVLATVTLIMLAVRAGSEFDPGAAANVRSVTAAVVGGIGAAVGLYVLSVARYLVVDRSDITARQTAAVFAHAPLAAVWSLSTLRVWRWYAMATIARTGWGTRQEVEISAGAHGPARKVP